MPSFQGMRGRPCLQPDERLARRPDPCFVRPPHASCMRQICVSRVVVAGAGYILASTIPPVLAKMSPWPVPARGWRIAAWVFSLVVFAVHLAAERRRRTPPLRAAAYVAFAVALGAAGVAAVGPLRAHWAEPGRLRLILLSVVTWPLLTGIPAFAAALLGRVVLDRASGLHASHLHVA